MLNYSNWFPHVAPDNKKFVFLSYVESKTNPFGKNVKLRLYNLITTKGHKRSLAMVL